MSRKKSCYSSLDPTRSLNFNLKMCFFMSKSIRFSLSNDIKDTKATAYTASIRSTLEYCSGVWDPYTADLVKKVGKIQRRAVRMVYNNYDWTVSVNALMKDLDLDPLSLRRKTSRLVTLHKAIGGHFAWLCQSIPT